MQARTDNSLRPVASFGDLSALRVTSIAQLRKCPKLWALQAFGTIPRLDSPASRIGTAVHLVIETYLRGQLELFRESWDATALPLLCAAEVPEKEQQNVHEYLLRLHEEETRQRLVAVEHEFRLMVGDLPVPLEGHIDLLTEEPDGALRITDHKTNRSYEGIDHWSRQIQPRLYALAARRLWPGRPVRFRIGLVNLGRRVEWDCPEADDVEMVRLLAEVWEELRVYDRTAHWPERLNEHCGFCPVKSTCPTLKTHFETLRDSLLQPEGETLLQRWQRLVTARKVADELVAELKPHVLAAVEQKGGALQEAGFRVSAAPNQRRQAGFGPVWQLLQAALDQNPEMHAWIGEFWDVLFSVKVGGLDRLAVRCPELQPYLDRLIATVEGEPILRLQAVSP